MTGSSLVWHMEILDSPKFKQVALDCDRCLLGTWIHLPKFRRKEEWILDNPHYVVRYLYPGLDLYRSTYIGDLYTPLHLDTLRILHSSSMFNVHVLKTIHLNSDFWT